LNPALYPFFRFFSFHVNFFYLSRTPAPDLTPENVGEVVETRPQVDANAPSQLIREICARVSYPRASKSSSGANPRVAEKRSTPARARQGAAQGKGAARKKAPQGGVSRKGSQCSPARIGRKSDSKKRHRSSSRSSSSSSSSSADSSVVSVDFFWFRNRSCNIFLCCHEL